MSSCLCFLLPDDKPKLEPVVQKSSSPGLVQPEAPVERLEPSTPQTEPPSIIESELPSPAPLIAPVSVSLPMASTSERPAARELTVSASSPSSSIGERKPSSVPPLTQTSKAEKPLSDAPRTLAASPVPAPKALNGLADIGADQDTAGQEPSPLCPAALQQQASASSYKEASSETLPSDLRPEVPIAASLTPMAPVAVVPVTLTSSPAPALPAMPPPGLPPLVQATTEADEPSKSLDTKEIASGVGPELHGIMGDGKSDSQQQVLTRKSPNTGMCCSQLHVNPTPPMPF